MRHNGQQQPMTRVQRMALTAAITVSYLIPAPAWLLQWVSFSNDAAWGLSHRLTGGWAQIAEPLGMALFLTMPVFMIACLASVIYLIWKKN
jgi:hypothetical protein